MIKVPFPLIMLLAGSWTMMALASPPDWWTTRGIYRIDPSTSQPFAADDFALLTQGQLKNVAVGAMAEMDARLPQGAGAAIHQLVAGWTPATDQTDDFGTVNLGQLKNLARTFYDRLLTAGCATAYPWSGSANAADDNALANIGQAKNLFSFDLLTVDAIPDADANGLPDRWEIYYFGHTGVNPNADANGDGVSNLQSLQNGTSPVAGILTITLTEPADAQLLP